MRLIMQRQNTKLRKIFTNSNNIKPLQGFGSYVASTPPVAPGVNHFQPLRGLKIYVAAFMTGVGRETLLPAIRGSL
jgi:hypothetical protein